MIIDNSNLSFHDVVNAATKNDISTMTKQSGVKPMTVIISCVVIVGVFAIGYYLGKKNEARLYTTSNFSKKIHEEELSKETKS